MPKIKCVCKKCSKEFFVWPYRIKNNIVKFCSMQCYDKYKIGKNVGINNHNWKGDKIGYFGIHTWLNRRFGRPKKCENCGTTDLNKRYHWANISGEYKRDISHFKRMCFHCHNKFDNHLRPRGESHCISKLSEKNIVKIRNLYKTKNYTLLQIADIFKVNSRSTISNIIRRKTWKHV